MLRKPSTSALPPPWVLVLGLILLVALVRPYAGLRHDAILYLGQLIQRGDPSALAADIFFAHGSQDSYSLYSLLVGPLLRVLPFGVVQALLLLVTQCATYAALFRLLKPLENPAVRWAGLAMVACLSRQYGGLGIFGFAEDFLTARSLAEPLTLWALVAALEQRHRLWPWLILAAGLLHPIMALPGCCVIWILLVLRDRCWLWALALLLVPVALMLMEVPPFTALSQRYGAAWWALIAEVNPQVLFENWRPMDWQRIGIDALVLLMGWRCLPASLSRCCLAVLAASALLLSLAVVGGDLIHNVLLTQLQLWRVLWIAHAVALCILPGLLWMAWHLVHPAGKPLAAAGMLMALGIDQDLSFGWALLIWPALWLLLIRQGIEVNRRSAWGGIWVSVAMVAMLGVIRVLNALLVSRLGYFDAPPRSVLLQALSLPAMALLLFWLTWRLWAVSRALSLAVLALALGIAVPNADARSEWTQLIEKGLPGPHPFNQFVEPGAQVYWHEEFAPVWVWMHRPSYYSKAQAAGLLFNEATALDFRERWEAWEPVREQVLGCRFSSLFTRHSPSECITPSEANLVTLCSSQKRLDYLIIERRLRLPPLASWNPRLPSHPELNFHLYACQQLRQSPPVDQSTGTGAGIRALPAQ